MGPISAKTLSEEDQLKQKLDETRTAVSAYVGFITAFSFAIFSMLGELWDSEHRNILILCGILSLCGTFSYLALRNTIVHARITPRPFRHFLFYWTSNLLLMISFVIFLWFLASSVIWPAIDMTESIVAIESDIGED